MKRILLAVLVLGLFMVSASVALAGKPSGEGRTEFSMLVDDPCLGEPVQFTGFQRITTRTIEDASGTRHVVTHMNVSNLVGVGESGTIYRGTGMNQETMVLRDGEWITSGVYNGPVIGRGAAPNSMMHVLASPVLNPDGTPVMEDGFPKMEIKQAVFACRNSNE